MSKIQTDWLGRCPKQSLRLNLTAQQFRERLQGVLVKDELITDVLFSTESRYTGTFHSDRFVIWPCKRRRQPQPELTGKVLETEGTIIVEFEIALEPMLSAWLTLAPFIAGFFLLIPIIAFLF